MAETRAFQSEFDSLVTNGVCNGIELLPSYWRQRQKLDIGVFVLNAVSALVLGGLGSKLVAVYRKRMTVRVGEGQERRVYKVRWSFGMQFSLTKGLENPPPVDYNSDWGVHATCFSLCVGTATIHLSD